MNNDDPSCSEMVLQELRLIKDELADGRSNSDRAIIAMLNSNRILVTKVVDSIDSRKTDIPIRIVYLIFGLVFALEFGIKALGYFLKLGAL